VRYDTVSYATVTYGHASMHTAMPQPRASGQSLLVQNKTVVFLYSITILLFFKLLIE
jgi:hypothetical protein